MDRKLLSSRLREMSTNTGTLNCLGCGYEHSCSTRGCAVLKKAAEIVEKSEWISINDMMPPEKSGKVIMTDGKRHYMAPREWMHRINGSSGIYIPANHGAGAKITHWMPLPEPPKGG